MTSLIQVSITTGSEAEATKIADHLLQHKLAACVQVSGPICSRYHWKGQLETSTEWLCVAKTRAALFDQLAAAVRSLHSYDEPEILATAISHVSPGYSSWVIDNTNSET